MIAKPVRFSELFIEEIMKYKEETGLKTFSSTVRAMIRVVIDTRKINSIGNFTRTLNDLQLNNNALSRLGNNLNQLVRLYTVGKVPEADKLIDTINELYTLVNKNLENNVQLRDSITFNEPK